MRALRVFFASFLVLFVEVALIRWMPAEMSALPPLAAYTITMLGSLAGVIAFAVMSWRELPPSIWFSVALVPAMPLLLQSEEPSRPVPFLSVTRLGRIAGVVLLLVS